LLYAGCVRHYVGPERSDYTHSSLSAQRRAFARKFAAGLLQPFSGFKCVLCDWAKSRKRFFAAGPGSCSTAKHLQKLLLSHGKRPQQLVDVARKSVIPLTSLIWNSLPEIIVVSDATGRRMSLQGSCWWPTPITVLTRAEICEAASTAGFRS